MTTHVVESLVGAGIQVGELLLGHGGGHQVEHRPHASADLGVAGKAGLEAVVDVLILVACD